MENWTGDIPCPQGDTSASGGWAWVPGPRRHSSTCLGVRPGAAGRASPMRPLGGLGLQASSGAHRANPDTGPAAPAGVSAQDPLRPAQPLRPCLHLAQVPNTSRRGLPSPRACPSQACGPWEGNGAVGTESGLGAAVAWRPASVSPACQLGGPVGGRELLHWFIRQSPRSGGGVEPHYRN